MGMELVGGNEEEEEDDDEKEFPTLTKERKLDLKKFETQLSKYFGAYLGIKINRSHESWGKGRDNPWNNQT